MSSVAASMAMAREERDGIRYLVGKNSTVVAMRLALGAVKDASITSVVLKGWSNIETGLSMGSPSATLGRCLVDKDFGSRWCHGGSIEIEDAFKLSPSR